MYSQERSISPLTSRWKMMRRAPVIVVLFVCLFLGTGAVASTVLPMSVETMARASDCVVEATILSVSSAWNANRTQITTDVQIDVTEVLGGDCELGSRVLHILGGQVGDMEMRVAKGPRFQPQEEVVLFLVLDPDLFVPVVGLAQGKLDANWDPTVLRERIGNDAVGYFDRNELFEIVTAARGGK